MQEARRNDGSGYEDESGGEWDEVEAGRRFLDEAEAVFSGTVTSMGEDPAFISGDVPAYQRIMLTVTDVERGDLAAGDDVDLDVLIVDGAPFVAPNEEGIPALDRSVVDEGVGVRVHAVWEDGRWRMAFSDDALAATGANA